MTTLAQLADRAQAALNDTGAATWTQAQIEEWANSAIRDYSARYPRQAQTTQACSAADRQYDLPADFRDMLSAEYPSGQSPPQFLTRRDRTRTAFWSYTDSYDIIRHDNAGDPDEFLMNASPTGSQSIIWTYTADHDSALAAGGTVTVPADHHNILILFIIWQALNWLHISEATSPTTASSLLTEQLANSARKARDDYQAALDAAGRTRSNRDITWRMDPYDPIY